MFFEFVVDSCGQTNSQIEILSLHTQDLRKHTCCKNYKPLLLVLHGGQKVLLKPISCCSSSGVTCCLWIKPVRAISNEVTDMKNKFEEGFHVHHLQKITCNSLLSMSCDARARLRQKIIWWNIMIVFVSMYALQFWKLDKSLNSYCFSVVKMEEG